MTRQSKTRMKSIAGAPAVEAHYIPSPLPEYRGNPFIEALPPETSYERLAAVLPERPPYDESERQLPSQVRAHCIQRLFQYFEPLGRHYDAGMRLDLLLRSGYRKRNPVTAEFRARMQEIYRRSQEKDFDGDGLETLPPSMSMSLIGVSGTGKTRSLHRAFAQYPKLIWHPHYQIHQIPWLIVECPHDGSVKQLCLAFFKNVDKTLGTTNYAERFGGRAVTAEQRVMEVAEIARLHAIGIIVFDELQFIRPARRTGIEKLLNFFVTLVNVAEAPIVLVGTMAAQDLLQADFSKARRGAGLGGLVWERFERTDEWDYLMRELWKYQWTQVASAFTPEISEVFYERTQGVVDLAVKLYVLSQYRAMITGVEEITPELMNTVADDEFKLLKPMLDALASGDPVLIAKYDDLRPLEFEKLMKREQLRMSEQIDVQALRRRFEQEQASKRAQALESLRAVGMTDAMAELAVSTMFASSGGQTSAEEVSKVLDIIKPRRPASPKRGASRKSLGKDYSDEDLRNIASAGGSTSDGYGTLLAARVVVGPMAVLSA
jgi:hypothetical protein